MKRCFEYVGGNSEKFWEVAVAGSEVTVRFGHIGTTGQSRTKLLPDGAAAAQHAEKLVESKLRKGYREVAVR